ncbi:barstar family protein [Catellatospora coxensis]
MPGRSGTAGTRVGLPSRASGPATTARCGTRAGAALAHHGFGLPDRPAGRTYHLDGRFVTDVEGFYCAIGEAVNGPGGYFGWNLDALVDCLRGRWGPKLHSAWSGTTPRSPGSTSCPATTATGGVSPSPSTTCSDCSPNTASGSSCADPPL